MRLNELKPRGQDDAAAGQTVYHLDSTITDKEMTHQPILAGTRALPAECPDVPTLGVVQVQFRRAYECGEEIPAIIKAYQAGGEADFWSRLAQSDNRHCFDRTLGAACLVTLDPDYTFRIGRRAILATENKE